jgi:exosortase
MAALFRFSLLRLWLKTNPITGEANWGHSLFVPLVGLYYLYIHREALLATRIKTAWSGMLFLVGGILIFGYGIWPGQNDFVKDFGMVVTIFGLVLLMCGWQVMKIAWFPIVFLICAIPWPGLVYSWIASPLQILAANVAVKVLSFVGVPAIVSGTKIFIDSSSGPPRTLNVAEACAGLRSLMTFISVAAAVAFLSSRPLWQKILITLMAVPIAIFCNVMRVSGQGLLDHYWSQELSQGFAHAFVGTIMLIPGFFLILLCGWFLDMVLLEEVDEKDRHVEAAKQTWRRADAMKRAEPIVSIPSREKGQVIASDVVAKDVVAKDVVAQATTPAKAGIAPVAKPAAAQETAPAPKAAPAPAAPKNIPIPPVSRAASPPAPRAVMPPRPNIPRPQRPGIPPTPPARPNPPQEGA